MCAVVILAEKTMNNRVDYEHFWKGYWNDATVYGPACRHRRRIVRSLVESIPHHSILDLGCGDGSLLAECAHNVTAEFEGSDISAEALAIARRALPDVRFFELDLMQGGLDKAYDVIILSEVLEHIEDDEFVLKAIAPHARHVVISVPGGPADKVDRRYGHFRNYTGTLLDEKLERCGYDIVRSFRWGFPLYDLQQTLSYQDGEWGSATMAGGSFGLFRRLLSRIIYAAYFLNSSRRGQQVFAVAKSRSFDEIAG